MSTYTLNNTDDIIDVRDIIERFEELETTHDNLREEFDDMPENKGVDFDNWICNQSGFSRDEYEEFKTIKALLEDLKDYGGDEQWRGDWYPQCLIRESYFTDYAQVLCEDIGDIPRDLPTYIEIDWEATARNLKVDYSEVDIDGVTYFYR